MSDIQQQENQDNTIENNDNDFTIQIEVCNPQERDSKLGTFTMYTIKGVDREGEFEVFRRYNDFLAFRQSLVYRWPGVLIPPIPEKQAIGNKDQSFIEERQKFLNYFCKKIAEKDILYYSDEGNVFFRTKSENIEPILQQLPVMTVERIIEKYKTTFKYLSGKDLNGDLILKVNNFKAYIIKQAKTGLENMRNFTRNLQTSQQSLQRQTGTLVQGILPEYEKTCIEPYLESDVKFDQNQLIQGPASEMSEQLKQGSSYQFLNEFIIYENREIQAFLEAFKEKERYEAQRDKVQQKIQENQLQISQLLQNKKSLKTIFKNKETMVNECEKNIEIYKAALQKHEMLVDLMNLVMGYVEIDNFKAYKSQKYFELIQQISQHEFILQSKNLELWKSVNEKKFESIDLKPQESKIQM